MSTDPANENPLRDFVEHYLTNPHFWNAAALNAAHTAVIYDEESLIADHAEYLAATKPGSQ